MKEHRHITGLLPIFLLCHGLFLVGPVKGFSNGPAGYSPDHLTDSVPGKLTDTIPKKEKSRKGITRYINILTDRQQRDSLFVKLSRQNVSPPTADSVLWRNRQNNFTPYKGKIIRNIYYNQLKVFGTEFQDTSYKSSHKLVRFANRLHLNTQEWVIRQALFFRENDTVNAYKLVDNERYLRNLAFIQDARIYVINTYQDSDSIDIVVLTKDVFEYGGTLMNLSNTSVAASVYNNNLLGAAQQVYLGYKWDETYRPQSRGEVSYTKYNLSGSFTDVSVGVSALNDRPTVDSGVYERSYFFSANRPLYTTWAKFTGGLTLSHNRSMNIYSLPDSVYRNYEYEVVDLWAGLNCRNQFKTTGVNSHKPNIALMARSYNLNFTEKPWQQQYQKDPYYNDHRYLLGQVVWFHSDFFKTNYFLGFGRTEDIPSGYNISTTAGVDNWVGLKRLYTSVQAQKYWLGKNNGLFSGMIALGTFWHNSVSQDAVLHIQANYYSNLWRIKQHKIRQFLYADYIGCPNPELYETKPLNINRESGILGYRNTWINGYQRLNMSAQTMYYSPLSIYGFKFNFYMLLQASLLSSAQESVLKSPFYSGIGMGCMIRNENLAFNTLQIYGTYLPPVTGAPKSFFFQITSTTAFNFNIFALQAPAEIPYK